MHREGKVCLAVSACSMTFYFISLGLEETLKPFLIQLRQLCKLTPFFFAHMYVFGCFRAKGVAQGEISFFLSYILHLSG